MSVPVTDETRDAVMRLLDGIVPWDEVERTHLARAREWAGSGAPLYRVRKPDVPPMHLVCYFVVCDETRDRLLLVAHRKAGLWLPAGGHVEPGENPWDTVVRECREEVHIDAVPSAVAGPPRLADGSGARYLGAEGGHAGAEAAVRGDHHAGAVAAFGRDQGDDAVVAAAVRRDDTDVLDRGHAACRALHHQDDLQRARAPRDPLGRDGRQRVAQAFRRAVAVVPPAVRDGADDVRRVHDEERVHGLQLGMTKGGPRTRTALQPAVRPGRWRRPAPGSGRRPPAR